MERGEDWIPIGTAIASAILICAFAVSYVVGYPRAPNGVASLTVALLLIASAGLFRFLKFVWTMWRSGVPNPIVTIRNSAHAALKEFSPIALGVLILGTFLFGITYLKSMLDTVVPFWADEPLALIDQAFMIQPERIAIVLRPVLPQIGLFYGLWHAAHLGGIVWVLHWRSEARSRFIISFMLTWAIGMFVAYVMSSAGPIFTGRYDPALAPPSVQKPVQILWQNYKSRGALLGGGISAFPSMHVAVATWFALVLREKGLPWVGAAYAVAIFFCSVVLGWHYAADGVGGVAIAVVAHRLSCAWFAQIRLQNAQIASARTAFPS